MVLVIDNYDSFTYNLVQYLGELGAEVQVRRNDRTTLDEIKRLAPERIVISPGPKTPTEAGIPEIMHGKTSRITHDSKTIFCGLSSPFTATRYHSLIVERGSLPACLEISATSPDGLIMGLRHREMKVEGVQFHPESVLTDAGKQLLANFLRL